MIESEFEDKLKQFPCPECGMKGGLRTKSLVLRIRHNQQNIEVDGEGWVCEGGCGMTFMSDELTELLVNKVAKAEGNDKAYFELDTKNGSFKEYSMQ